jgi:hypothetical protein
MTSGRIFIFVASLVITVMYSVLIITDLFIFLCIYQRVFIYKWMHRF